MPEVIRTLDGVPSGPCKWLRMGDIFLKSGRLSKRGYCNLVKGKIINKSLCDKCILWRPK